MVRTKHAWNFTQEIENQFNAFNVVEREPAISWANTKTGTNSGDDTNFGIKTCHISSGDKSFTRTCTMRDYADLVARARTSIHDGVDESRDILMADGIKAEIPVAGRSKRIVLIERSMCVRELSTTAG